MSRRTWIADRGREWLRRLSRFRRPPSGGSRPRRTPARWSLVALGLALLAAAFAGAADPYRQTRAFSEVMACDQGAGNCFGTEPGFVVGRRTYTTDTTHTDADGMTSTTATTHYEITWHRADGTGQARDVSSAFYAKALEGSPVELRLWRGEVVGVEVRGGSQWFLPRAGESLGYWMHLAFLGLGVALWGLLFGWWDGFFLLAFRTFCWMFMGVVPVRLATDALAGLDPGILDIAIGGFFVAVAGGMLLGSLERR